MAYHIVFRGYAVLEDPEGGSPEQLEAGDILLLANGVAHTSHDGGGARV